MGQVDFCRADFAARLFTDELVNVAVAHANLGAHLASRCTLKQQLAAAFTETVAVQAFTDQAALQLAHRRQAVCWATAASAWLTA